MLRTTPLIGSGLVLSSNAICRLLELHCAISDRQGEGGGGDLRYFTEAPHWAVVWNVGHCMPIHQLYLCNCLR